MCNMFSDDTTLIIPGETQIKINNRIKIIKQAIEEKLNSIDLNIKYTKTLQLVFATKETQLTQKLLIKNSRQNHRQNSWDCNTG